MATPRHPALFKVKTRFRLSELTTALGRQATLDDIPDLGLDRLAADGFSPGRGLTVLKPERERPHKASGED